MSSEVVRRSINELQGIVRCRCSPAYKDRGLHDPSCECDSAEAVTIVADRIEELEAKLAKAVTLGNQMARAIEYGLLGWQDAVREWDTFTLELKGETNEQLKVMA